MSATRDALHLGTVRSLVSHVRQSFHASIGDVVFGMEDGTVSIFGLVFGVAASTDQSAVVLLAGGTGAIAAAVSMMAGPISTRNQSATEHVLRRSSTPKRGSRMLGPRRKRSASIWPRQGSLTPRSRRCATSWHPILRCCERSGQLLCPLSKSL